MERCTMFLEWKNQHWMTMNTIGNLQIQCNPYQISNGIFHGIRTKISQFIWKHKRPRIAKAILRKKNGVWMNQTPWLQTVLQSYSNLDSMLLAQKQKYRSVELDRKPRDKPTHLWSPNLWQRGKNIQWRKNNLFNKWLGKLDSYM